MPTPLPPPKKKLKNLGTNIVLCLRISNNNVLLVKMFFHKSDFKVIYWCFCVFFKKDIIKYFPLLQ